MLNIGVFILTNNVFEEAKIAGITLKKRIIR